MDIKSPIPVITTGKGFLFVDKPSGVSVHNDRKNVCSMILDFLRPNKKLLNQIDFDPSFGMNAVHRLDRDTSGIILLACNPQIFKYFSRQFEERTVKKKYVALLHGNLALPDEKGLWSWPLSRKPGGRVAPSGKGDKQPCETQVTIVHASPHYTWVECTPHTGRKHQIRRHAKLSGHPVVGDSRYGSPRSLKFLSSKRGFNRLALHSASISIRLPERSETKEIRSPKIPEDIEKLFNDDLAGD